MLSPQNKGSETKYTSSKNCVFSSRETRVQIPLGEEQHLHVIFNYLFNKWCFLTVVASEGT